MSQIRLFLTMVASLAACSVLWGNLFAAPRYSPWSTPVNLGTPVNSAFAESKATLSKNGLSLYFSSNRPCGSDDTVLDANLWVAHRSWPDGVWESVDCLTINVNPTLAGETVSPATCKSAAATTEVTCADAELLVSAVPALFRSAI